MKNRIFIIDGSSYLYRAYHAMPPLTTSSGRPTGAVKGVTNMLMNLKKESEGSPIIVVFDAKGKNFRHSIYDLYKANRNAMPLELSEQTGPIIDLVKAYGLKVIQEDGVEADDVIASAVTQIKLSKTQTIISSGDKDLAQLVTKDVVLMNNFDTKFLDIEGVIGKFGVEPKQIFDYLCLVGDTSDNIPGVPKVGPKTAVSLLTKYKNLSLIHI